MSKRFAEKQNRGLWMSKGFSSQEAERKLQVAEDKARGLSWPEVLSLWHSAFSNPQIRHRYHTVRASGLTTAINRRHPKRLRLWTNFHGLHRSCLCNQLAKPEAEAFESRQFYQKIAEVHVKLRAG